MNDRQWDDWVRGQPGTFWGEQKRQLSQPAKIRQPTYRAPQAGSARPGAVRVTGGGSAGAAKAGSQSFEDNLRGLLTLGAGVAAGILAYQLETAVWLGIVAVFGAMIGIHSLLDTRRGHRFLELLGKAIGIAFLGGIIWMIIWVIQDVSAGS